MLQVLWTAFLAEMGPFHFVLWFCFSQFYVPRFAAPRILLVACPWTHSNAYIEEMLSFSGRRLRWSTTSSMLWKSTNEFMLRHFEEWNVHVYESEREKMSHWLKADLGLLITDRINRPNGPADCADERVCCVSGQRPVVQNLCTSFIPHARTQLKG